MEYIIPIIAIASFVYGAWGLLTSNLLAIDLKAIEEKYRRLYSKLCGLSLLLESVILGTGYYLQKREQLNSPFVFSLLLLIPLSVFFVARKTLKKRKS